MFLDKIKEIITGDEISRFKKRGGKIGENCKLYHVDLDYGHSFLITIGNNVTMTNCTVLAHDASTEKVTDYTRVGKVTIGNNVFVGVNSIILPNVNIGDNCIIGAGSIVTKSIPEGSIVAGNPARIIGKFDDFRNKYESLIKEKPKYETVWQNKSDEERQKMIEEIIDIGFDK